MFCSPYRTEQTAINKAECSINHTPEAFKGFTVNTTQTHDDTTQLDKLFRVIGLGYDVRLV
jgi:hypothetical protein